jgi:hypothetical protein
MSAISNGSFFIDRVSRFNPLRERIRSSTGAGMITPGAGAAANSLLGPLVLRNLEYNTSPDTLNPQSLTVKQDDQAPRGQAFL